MENLNAAFVSGGEVQEDVNFFRQEAFKAKPVNRFCSTSSVVNHVCFAAGKRLTGICTVAGR